MSWVAHSRPTPSRPRACYVIPILGSRRRWTGVVGRAWVCCAVATPLAWGATVRAGALPQLYGHMLVASHSTCIGHDVRIAVIVAASARVVSATQWRCACAQLPPRAGSEWSPQRWSDTYCAEPSRLCLIITAKICKRIRQFGHDFDPQCITYVVDVTEHCVVIANNWSRPCPAN